MTLPAHDMHHLDRAIPECVDHQQINIYCAEEIHINRGANGFTEPTSVNWPTLSDNDPNIKLSSNLINLGFEPYAFNGTEKEIKWIAVDQHGETAECSTKIFFKSEFIYEISFGFVAKTFVHERLTIMRWSNKILLVRGKI